MAAASRSEGDPQPILKNDPWIVKFLFTSRYMLEYTKCRAEKRESTRLWITRLVAEDR